MTAEMAILNKEAVALAADSAVTFGRPEGQKVLTSANKIFALSKYQPVGVMVYGSAEFMGIPWESVIKVYRAKMGERSFATLRQYADDLLRFLGKERLVSTDAQQEDYVRSSVYSYFRHIRDGVRAELGAALGGSKEVGDSRIARLTRRVVEKHHKLWVEADLLPTVPKSQPNVILRKYGRIISKALTEVFENLPIGKALGRRLREIGGTLFAKSPGGVVYSGVSGVVVAGFGTEDLFPSLRSFTLEGVAANRLKYEERGEQGTEIGFRNAAAIVPFAQSEMVFTFMEGVQPSYQAAVEKDLSDIFREYPAVILDNIPKLSEREKGGLKRKLQRVGARLLEQYVKKLKSYRNANYVEPVIDVVAILPKDELSAMAESLVNLTSFKRKVSVGTETVAGPVDVAVISRGDGFIWIKRKHYFRAELNPQFFANYFREADGGKEE